MNPAGIKNIQGKYYVNKNMLSISERRETGESASNEVSALPLSAEQNVRTWYRADTRAICRMLLRGEHGRGALQLHGR